MNPQLPSAIRVSSRRIRLTVGLAVIVLASVSQIGAAPGDLVFTPVANYAAGTAPVAIVEEDFDGDFISDLLVLNSGSDSVSFLKGNADGLGAPDGTFAAPVDSPAGANPQSFTVFDFNDDLIGDLAVTNFTSNKISVLEGVGDGTFLPPIETDVSDGPLSVAWGFIDEDDIPDLAVVGTNNTINILYGTGDGNFTLFATIILVTRLGQVTLKDLDFDNYDDIIVATPDADAIRVIFNDGFGDYDLPGTAYAAGDAPVAFLVDDLDTDFEYDLAVVNSGSDNISILHGQDSGIFGPGTFAPPVNFAVGDEPSAIYAEFFDFDGSLDLVVTNAADDTVNVLLNDGDGAFTIAATLATGDRPVGVTACSFTPGLMTDIATANQGSNNASVFLGVAEPVLTGTLSAPSIPLGGTINNQATIDLDPFFFPEGTLTFNAYGPDDATCSLPPAFSEGPVPVLGLGDYISSDFTPTVPGTYRWTIQYSGDPYEDVGPAETACNAPGQTVDVLGSADISISKAGPASVTAGQDITYTLTITNNGPDQTAGVVVSDPTPANLAFVSNSGACLTAFPCNVGLLLNGQSAIITSTYSTSPSFSGNVSNTATVSATQVDPNPGNNSALASTNVFASADLSIVKTGPSSGIVGANITYTITVSNAGPSPAPATSVADMLPTGLALVSATPTQGSCSGSGTVNCALGTLTAGQAVTITLVTSTGATTPVTVSNTATVGSSATDPNPANNLSTAADVSMVKTAQTITFNSLSNRTFDDPPFAISATATSGLTVTFNSLTTGVCSVSNTFPGGIVTIVGAGSCTIVAEQNGDPFYSGAPQELESFNVARADQVITFAPITDKPYNSSFPISATGGGSGNPILFISNTESVCTISGTTVSTVGIGLCSITASQAGEENYNVALEVTRSFNVVPANQTITFAPLGNRALGSGTFTVSATSDSSLPVTFMSLTDGVCTMLGNTVTLVAAGTCTIAADQIGNANYNAAPRVSQSFTVTSGCSGLSLPATLSVGRVAIPYNQTLTLTNGAAPVTMTLTGALPSGLTFTNGVFAGVPLQRGAFPITVTATDNNSCEISASYDLAIAAERRLVIGAASGGSTVRAFNIASATVLSEINAFGGFTGGASVAQGDVDGNGIADVVIGAGPGMGPAVGLFDGASRTVRLLFLAFDPAFNSGVGVATGDVTGDGVPEILAAAGCPSGAVRAFDGRTGALVRAFSIPLPVPSCRLHVAAGDVNGDGTADIMIGAADIGASFVEVIDGVTGAHLRELYPFGTAFMGGASVAAGDVNGDGFADIVTGAGPGGTPHVRVFDGTSGAQIAGPLGSFFAYTPFFAGGVRVGAGDLDGDGRAEVITGAGPGGGPHFRVWDGATATEIYGLFGFDPSFTGGVAVAGPTTSGRMHLDIATRTTGSEIRIAGWALREIATDTTGTDAIDVWAFPARGGAPVFVGEAPARVPRFDVATAFGGEFLMAGFDFTGTLTAGAYDLVVFARNSRTLLFDQALVARVTLP